jgi:cytochrome c2
LITSALPVESKPLAEYAKALQANTLKNQTDVLPGQKMNYQVSEAADRADLVAFLKRESGK